MKKIFISYKFTGEDPAELAANLDKIASALRSKGHEIYCTLNDKQSFKGSIKEIFNYTIGHLVQSDIVLVFINSDQKSEGMLLEAGYALAIQKPLVVAIKNGIQTSFLKDLSSAIINFNDIDDLRAALLSSNDL